MRLICTLNDQRQGYLLSTYLSRQGIENQLELVTNTDWGSPDYGTILCRIWALEEDNMNEALAIATEFQEHPNDQRFATIPSEPSFQNPFQNDEVEQPALKPSRAENPSLGPITFYILMICSLLLLFSELTSPTVTTKPSPSIPYTPVFSSSITKKMLYDYPHAYEIIDEIVDLFGADALATPETLPKEGQVLLQKFERTPYWQGFYEKLVKFSKNTQTPWNMNAPLFEKIRQGEVWRFFSPALLHHDIFHLFFNMIWLVILGRQIEQRLGKWRYILFIAIAAFFSNTAQYLMSGSNFVGFSGVLCAMLTFIWIRQKQAAWEGYQLDRGTLAFIAFFILFMFGLQVISFLLEAYTESAFSIGIANTAHLTGALVGYFLGKLSLFRWRS